MGEILADGHAVALSNAPTTLLSAPSKIKQERNPSNIQILKKYRESHGFVYNSRVKIDIRVQIPLDKVF